MYTPAFSHNWQLNIFVDMVSSNASTCMNARSSSLATVTLCAKIYAVSNFCVVLAWVPEFGTQISNNTVYVSKNNQLYRSNSCTAILFSLDNNSHWLYLWFYYTTAYHMAASSINWHCNHPFFYIDILGNIYIGLQT